MTYISYSKGPYIYKVRQRRTRVYGIATPEVGDSQERMARLFAECVSQLANIGTRFPLDVLFNPDLPKQSIENNPILFGHVEKARKHAANTGRSDDIYVDASSSARGVDPIYIYSAGS